MGLSIQNRSVLYKTTEPVLVPEGVYEAELVALDGFDAALRQLVQTGTRGMNVTVPFKLDAELLADVYINLTRGQDALLIADDASEGADGQALTAVDLRGFNLPVLTASEQELADHEAVLTQIDKASGGKTIWRAASSA